MAVLSYVAKNIEIENLEVMHIKVEKEQQASY